MLFGQPHANRDSFAFCLLDFLRCGNSLHQRLKEWIDTVVQKAKDTGAFLESSFVEADTTITGRCPHIIFGGIDPIYPCPKAHAKRERFAHNAEPWRPQSGLSAK
jgi:hypothetical protein